MYIMWEEKYRINQRRKEEHKAAVRLRLCGGGRECCFIYLFIYFNGPVQ